MTVCPCEYLDQETFHSIQSASLHCPRVCSDDQLIGPLTLLLLVNICHPIRWDLQITRLQPWFIRLTASLFTIFHFFKKNKLNDQIDGRKLGAQNAITQSIKFIKVWMMVGLAGFEPRVAGWKMRANPLNYGCPQSEQFLLHANLFKSTWKRDWGWPPFRIERKTLKRKIVWQHFCPFRNILFRERILTRFPKIWTFFRSKLKSVFFRLNILQNCWDRKTSFITSRIAKTLN